MKREHLPVTVVVPTRNEAHNVGPFLASLPADVPLIVVDSSDDETPEIVYAVRPDNTTLLQQNVSLASARQIGGEAASTAWLLFTDADVVFAPDYFDALNALLQQPYDLIYGPKLSADRYTGYYRLVAACQRLCDGLGIPAASGSNLLMRRYVFRLTGGFDRSLVCNEDSEIAWRARRCGYRVRFCESLVVYARDHRRIDNQGRVGKSLHSITRCLLLYTGLMPQNWRSSDWGYWSRSAPA